MYGKLFDNARLIYYIKGMGEPKRNKVNSGLRLDAQVVEKAKELAAQSGQTETWWIENTLATAWGLRDWPKPPKKLKKAKELLNGR